MEQFMKKHNLTTTLPSFKTKYYTVKKRINEKNDYPIAKLRSLLQFIEENYNQAVTMAKNDIIYLEGEQAD